MRPRRAPGRLTVLIMALCAPLLAVSAAQATAPANDTIGTAQQRTSFARVDTTEAGTESAADAMLPDGGCRRGGASSVWFSFNSFYDGGTGLKDAVAWGSDTVLSVYRRPDAGGALSFVTCNDNAPGVGVSSSRATFTADFAFTYYIELSTVGADPGAANGPGHLFYSIGASGGGSSGDNYPAPADLGTEAGPGIQTASTALATADVLDPGFAAAARPTVWYSWRAPWDGVVEFAAARPANAWIAVDPFLWALVNGSEVVAHNDNVSGATSDARIRFAVSAGTAYRIELGSGRLRPGDLILTWQMPDLAVTTTTLTAAATGRTVRFTTAVRGPNRSRPAGVVEIREDGVLRRRITLSAGAGSAALSGVTPGTHLYRAYFRPTLSGTLSDSVSPGRAVSVS